MSQCDKTCEPCAYVCTITGGGLVCNYMLVTGARRGCSAGAGCDKFLRGARKSSIDSKIYCGVPEDKAAWERKKRCREAVQARLMGRQREAIRAFCERSGYSYNQIALAIGVSQATVAAWAKEYHLANWDKLSKLGLARPEGV